MIDPAVLGVDGIAVSIATTATVELTWFSDETSARLDDGQFTTGQGPVFDAIADHDPIQCRDLTKTTRWPAFTDHALGIGVHAVFAFPMIIGPTCVGAMLCHRRNSGPMSDDGIATAMALASLLRAQTLTWVPGRNDPKPAEFHRAEVHQAAGIVSAHLDAPVNDALARMRAYTFAHQRALVDVARDVIAGRLRLPSDAA
ncbi:ANTAR domain-containing protein [Amycolatopsis thailandensis]|nr:ANTAR domain-containing protein [Amycolatopsis thailandensis]